MFHQHALQIFSSIRHLNPQFHIGNLDKMYITVTCFAENNVKNIGLASSIKVH
jgi:hypothetical protein